MRRFALGAVTGALLTLAVATATGDWYEYYVADGTDLVMSRVNAAGWQIVPGQPDPRYLRRPRLRLH